VLITRLRARMSAEAALARLGRPLEGVVLHRRSPRGAFEGLDLCVLPSRRLQCSVSWRGAARAAVTAPAELVAGAWTVVTVIVSPVLLVMDVDGTRCDLAPLQPASAVGPLATLLASIAAAPAGAMHGAFVLGGERSPPVVLAHAWVLPRACAEGGIQADDGPPPLLMRPRAIPPPSPARGASLVARALAAVPSRSPGAALGALALLCDGAALSGAVRRAAAGAGVTRAVLAMACDVRAPPGLRVAALRTARALTLAPPGDDVPVAPCGDGDDGLAAAAALVAELWALVAAPAAVRWGAPGAVAGAPAAAAVAVASEAAGFLQALLADAAHCDAVRAPLRRGLLALPAVAAAAAAAAVADAAAASVAADAAAAAAAATAARVAAPGAAGAAADVIDANAAPEAAAPVAVAARGPAIRASDSVRACSCAMWRCGLNPHA
jgi:hypothetical protein